MRIVFKLWTKGKQNTIKMPAKSLQNLWRCSPEKMREILDDLIYNEIAEIKEEKGFIEFTCRRFVKENEISQIRRKAANSKSNQEQNDSKPKAKGGQNTDIDYEDEDDNESKDDNEVESKKPTKRNLRNPKVKEPTYEEFHNYAMEQGVKQNLNLDDTKVRGRYEAWKGNDWKTINPERKIKDWQATVRGNVCHWTKKENNGKGQQSNFEKFHNQHKDNPAYKNF